MHDVHQTTSGLNFADYNLLLVGLSYLIAAIASYAGLSLAQQVRSAMGRSRIVWLLGGAVAMGLGVWAMHFIAMLALDMQMPVRYDLSKTGLSLFFAVAASGLALSLVTRKQLYLRALLFSGSMMGIGIAAMHYTGMAAMHVAATLTYKPIVFAASILVAVVVAIAALWLVFYHSKPGERSARRHLFKFASAGVMGAAIVGMHYTGMAAAQFGHIETESAVPIGVAGEIGSTDLGTSVGVATLLILGLALVSTVLGTRFSQQEASLKLSRQRFRSLFDNHPDAIFTVDTAGQVMSANAVCIDELGFSTEKPVDVRLTSLLGEESLLTATAALRKSLSGEAQHFEATFVREGRAPFAAIVTLVPNIIGQTVESVFFIVKDVTETKALAVQLEHQAFHDPLTGLPNRALFLDRLGVALEREKRNPENGFAAIFLDFDHFKKINDSYGHAAGDVLLVGIGERLQNCLRPADTAARMGGDEFTLILEDIHSPRDAVFVAERVQKALAAPFNVQDQLIAISASMGIVTSEAGYTHPDEIVRDADIAMYQAKARGKACYAVFDVSMRERTLALLALEGDLRAALRDEQFELFYQPIVHTTSGIVSGFEALIRWQHPKLGFVAPGEFIPLAEDLGLIGHIDRWVVATACKQLKLWQSQNRRQFTLSVNISGGQFERPDFVGFIQSTLTENALTPGQLHLEVTERLFVENSPRVLTALEQLRLLGVQLHIDDFGTGYSSLSYLQRFAAHTLKIDRSFVNRLDDDASAAELVQTIVNMAHHLGMNVVAEGIETEKQRQQLQKFGCEYTQGFLFSHPLPPTEIETFLQSVPLMQVLTTEHLSTSRGDAR